MKPKYLVRPDGFSIFDLDESNGCYRICRMIILAIFTVRF